MWLILKLVFPWNLIDTKIKPNPSSKIFHHIDKRGSIRIPIKIPIIYNLHNNTKSN